MPRARAMKNVMRGTQKRSNIELAISAIKQFFKGGSPVTPPKSKMRGR